MKKMIMLAGLVAACSASAQLLQNLTQALLEPEPAPAPAQPVQVVQPQTVVQQQVVQPVQQVTTTTVQPVQQVTTTTVQPMQQITTTTVQPAPVVAPAPVVVVPPPRPGWQPCPRRLRPAATTIGGTKPGKLRSPMAPAGNVPQASVFLL